MHLSARLLVPAQSFRCMPSLAKLMPSAGSGISGGTSSAKDQTALRCKTLCNQNVLCRACGLSNQSKIHLLPWCCAHPPANPRLQVPSGSPYRQRFSLSGSHWLKKASTSLVMARSTPFLLAQYSSNTLSGNRTIQSGPGVVHKRGVRGATQGSSCLPQGKWPSGSLLSHPQGRCTQKWYRKTPPAHGSAQFGA